MISTGCQALDEFLQGYKEELTMIYGPAASGKTTLALHAAISQAEQGKKVLYIDTEGGFNVERITQLNPDPKILDNILLLRITDFMQQRVNFRKLKDLVEKGRINCVIMDTIGMHYRLYLQKNSYGANLCLKKQLGILKEISQLNIPVVITNQIYSKVESLGISPVGGKIVLNSCQTCIELQKEPNRRIIIKKPSPEKSMNITIKTEGIIKV